MSNSGRFFSVDSPKAIKAKKFGYVNAINYMAPAGSAGVGNLCADASPGCLALCLGWYSGQAGMLSNLELETGTNAARSSRARKSQAFMRDRPAFMRAMVAGIRSAQRQARRARARLCVRPNGATDIAWEAVKAGPAGESIFALFPRVQFVDYTKSLKRALRALSDPTWPRNYHLTFSRSELNEADCRQVLSAGGNVAVVFQDKPAEYLGRPVIDGDAHDLRHLDPRGGFIIGLSPKGRKAKADTSGFIVRGAA